MKKELGTWEKVAEGYFRYVVGICLERLRITTNNFFMMTRIGTKI
jgi:hypothetical protein